MTARPWSRAKDGLRLDVRLTPRSSADRLEGLRKLSDGTCVLAVRVRAVPESGRANDALLRLIAGALSLPVSDCILAAGAKGRIKSILISGDPENLALRLEALIAAAKD